MIFGSSDSTRRRTTTTLRGTAGKDADIHSPRSDSQLLPLTNTPLPILILPPELRSFAHDTLSPTHAFRSHRARSGFGGRLLQLRTASGRNRRIGRSSGGFRIGHECRGWRSRPGRKARPRRKRGGHHPTPLADVPIEAFDSAVAVNLRGVFLAMKFEIPAMLTSGGGAILNRSSTAGQQAVGGLAGYVSTKHGIEGLPKVAALDYAGQGVRVALPIGQQPTPVQPAI